MAIEVETFEGVGRFVVSCHFGMYRGRGSLKNEKVIARAVPRLRGQAETYTVLLPHNPTTMRRKQLHCERNQQKRLGSDDSSEVYAIDVSGCFLFLEK